MCPYYLFSYFIIIFFNDVQMCILTLVGDVQKMKIASLSLSLSLCRKFPFGGMVKLQP